MSKKIIRSQKHLTFSDRVYIEQSLINGLNFSSIGSFINKDPSTISKEIRRSSIITPARNEIVSCNRCMSKTICSKNHCCRKKDCTKLCKNCFREDPTLSCISFEPYTCNKRSKPPYVCNACALHQRCILEKTFYSAKFAQTSYEKKLTSSRVGINLTPSELVALNDLITPLILKGQPLSHIFSTHADEIPCCRRTLYNYLDQGVLKARNLDLHRRVRYKKRKKSTIKKLNAVDQAYRSNRTYKDFERFVETHPDSEIIEMDTVKGGHDSGKCLLTLLFRKSSFMLIILIQRCTQEYVISAINDLTECLSYDLFKKTFPIILTDNGSEFKNPYDIEMTLNKKRRTYVFYCDPYVSNQKARLEKNHEYIRYIIPKGRSMQRYTQENINLMASHINSTARDGLNNQTPFSLASLLLDKKIPILTGLHIVSPDDVMLKPELINR
jgi:IS30 family transposase